MSGPRLALLGDRREHRSHRELEALRRQLEVELGVRAEWVPTDGRIDLLTYDGVWLVPGSPYRDESAVYAALRVVRERGVPFLGTCGGMQYAVVEYVRNVLGRPATHQESDGAGAENVVTGLACSLQGVAATVTPVPGTRFASLVGEPFEGMHFCSYAPTPAAVAELASAGVVVGAVGDGVAAEVLDFPGHPFYVTSMFQPHIGALDHAPIHPLVRAFVEAASVRSSGRGV